MKKRVFSVKLIALLLIAFVLSATVVAISADEPVGDYDHSRPSSEHNVVLSGDELLSLYGVSISDVERAYLTKYSRIFLSYDDAVTTSSVVCEADGDSLSVTLYDYYYTAANGVELAWVPTSVSFGEREPITPTLLSEHTYSVTIEGVTAEERSSEAKLNVEFSREFVISASDMTFLMNQAYNDAVGWTSYSDYLADMAQYDADYITYTKYLEEKYVYDDALADYNRYLAELDAYNKAVENNERYDEAMAEYIAALAEYQEYLDELAGYEDECDEYEAYLAATKKLQDQLSAIEATLIKMTDDRTVYAAIMGGTVSEVLDNKDVIVGPLIGASAEVVDAAGVATEKLRVLLKAYFSYGKAFENYEDKYAYYAAHYEEFRDNFILLLRSLENLYKNEKVGSYIASEGKDWKYVILLAQLSQISNALSDGIIYSYDGTCVLDANHRVKYGKTTISFAEILENKVYLVDTGAASPDPNGYPAYMAEPTKPEYMPQPVRPERVEVPAKPDAVDEPTPPELVEEPTLPTEVAPPIPLSDSTAIPDEALALIDDLSRGLLTQRSAAATPLTLSYTKSVTKEVFNPDTHTVAFYDLDGNFISSTTVDSGTLAVYEGELPSKPMDAECTYSFDFWHEEGQDTPAALTSVLRDMKLYPSFRSSPRKYDVTFNIDGSKTTLAFDYGSLPLFTSPVLKADDEYREYVFSGWDRELQPVKESTEYTAVFAPRLLVPLPNGSGARVYATAYYYNVDTTGSGTCLVDVATVLSRIAASTGKGLLLKTDYGDLTMSYTTALAMHRNADTRISIAASNIPYGCKYRVFIGDASGFDGEYYRMTVSMPYSELDTGAARLKYVGADGASNYVPHNTSMQKVSFTLSTEHEYIYAVERELSVIPPKLVTLSVDRVAARPGETVKFTLDFDPWVEIKKIYLKYADGTEEVLEIDADSFTMPDSDVAIGVSVSLRDYTVVFKNGDRVIASYTLKYGDTITVPKDPSMLEDGTYSYTFIGWGADRSTTPAEISTVSRSVIYTALYDRELLPEREPEGLLISPKVLRLLIAGAIALGMVAAVVIPSLVISVVFIIKSRKMRIRVSKNCDKR